MPNALLEAGEPRKFGWADTWPVRLAQNALMAFRLPGDVYAGRVDPMSDEGIGRAADLAGLVTGGAYAAAPAMKNASGMGIRAYHGSPHDFDRFDLSKIGTGEGAQAYGHGLYFAENEGVARSYRDQLSKFTANKKPLSDDLSLEIGSFGGDVGKLLDYRKDQLDRWVKSGVKDTKNIIPQLQRDIRELERLQKKSIEPAGRMYEVDINAHPDQFLDWDKPLFAQGEPVKKALSGLGLPTEPQRQWTVKPTAKGDKFTVYDHWGQSAGTFSDRAKAEAKASAGTFRADSDGGMLAYSKLGGNSFYPQLDKGTASQRLLEAGIPGIKYLDQGSRAVGDGSRNYVVFDDSLINILRKYGLAGGAVTGAAAAGASDPAEAKAADQPAPFMSATLKLFGY